MSYGNGQKRRLGWAALTSRKRRRERERARERSRFQFRPDILPLEGRQLLATIDVTNTNASGSGSLAAAIQTANGNAQANTIAFTGSAFETAATITLGGELELTDTSGTQTIDGPAAGVTVDAQGASGVFVIDRGVTATLSGLTITGGSTSGDGGGVLNDGTVTLTDCSITGNSAQYGGGVCNQDQATMTLNSCTITGNSAAYAGGVFNIFRVTLDGCTISGNSATDQGGGLENDGAGTLNGCTISGNSAAYGGGVENYGNVALNDCTITGNSATDEGGGLENPSTATLTDCTITGNSATAGGGAANHDGTMTLNDCTITGNSATYASGMVNDGTMTLTGTIVAGNSGDNIRGASVSSQSAHNLIGTGGSGGLTNGQDGNLVGVADPLLGTLGNYGGPTETIPLLPGSPAIAAGTRITGITTDQRGLPLDSPTPDIGAFQANSLVVNTTSDGTASPSGDLSLRQAVNLANLLGAADAGAETITFNSTVFATAQTIDLTAGPLDLAAGTETILGPAAGVTVDAQGASRVFVIDSGVTATISGLTITGGSTSGDGGGVLNDGTVTLTDCSITGNSAQSGGGVDNEGTATLNDCTITENSAGKFGGGVYNVGTATLNDCTITGNSAQSGGGVDNEGTATLNDCTITENSAGKFGGGVYNLGTATLNDCTLSGNSTQSGGGVFNFDGTATLNDCTLSGNSTQSFGSGVFNYGTATLTDCTISGNTSNGVFNDGTATLTDCTISGNSAKEGGGVDNVGTMTLNDCTISGNSAIYGGGIDNTGTMTLTGTIVAGNSGGDIRGSTVSGQSAYNLVGTGGSGGLTNGQDGNLVGVADPLLGTLGNYGGPTETIPLLPGSPALAAGTRIAGITTDQRGGSLDSPTPDIGAFQTQGFVLTLVPNSSPQTAQVTERYKSLAVEVSPNQAGDPVDGGVITFAVTPAGDGASVTLSAATATINGGEASVGATANTTAGGVIVVTANANGVASPVNFDLTNTSLAPARIVVISGSGQTATVGTAFAGPLVVEVEDQYGNPVSEAPVTFKAPASGASASLNVTSGTTDSNGEFSVNATANANAGSYTVTASAFGVATSVSFSLTNATGQGGHFIVDQLGDAGVGSGDAGDLQYCINLANDADSASFIEIELGTTPATITLTGPVTLSNTRSAVTIYDGPSQGPVTISGNGTSRVLKIDSGVTATITGLTIADGSTSSYGGGVVNFGTMTLDDCTITGNTANGVDNIGTATLNDCTISGNSAADGGGVNNLGTMTLNDCTISGNSATYAGGIDNASTMTLTGTIVAGNSGGDIGGSTVSGQSAYNLVGVAGSGGLTNGQDGNLVGVADPLLGTLGNYGGPTETIPLLPGSPAIAAGTSIAGITTDQRGLARPATNPDIGAFQDQGFTITITGGGTQSTPIGQAFSTALAVTVTANDSVDPVDGGVVTFAAPASGASVSLSAITVTIGGNGQASVTATANKTVGSYLVTAAATGLATSADFQLTNTAAALTGFSVSWGSYGTAALVLPSPSGGVLLPTGRSNDLPWLGIDQFTVTFDTSVTLSAADVSVTSALPGVNYGPVTLTGSGMTYTVTLAEPIDQADRVTITIGNASIGTFTGVLPVVPGDVGDYGVVNATDMLLEEYQWLGIISPTIFGDVTGDVAPGSKPTETDFLTVDKLIGTTLPPEPPPV